MDFDSKQTARFIPKIEWGVLKSAVEQVNIFLHVDLFLISNLSLCIIADSLDRTMSGSFPIVYQRVTKTMRSF